MVKNMAAREADKIQDLIDVARLDASDLLPVVQAVCVGKQLCDDVKLLEINPELLGKVNEGQMLTIRGEPGETAVVCTESSTFELKEAETSNALLLFQDMVYPEEYQSNKGEQEQSVFPREIIGIFHTYFELRLCAPRLKKLREVLMECPYRGKEYEENNCKKYTYGNLLDCIQASKDELSSALEEIQACEIEGFWRILDFDYHFRVFSHIVDLIDSESIPTNKIPKQMIIETLKELEPCEIIEQCFHWYTELASDGNGEQYYALKEDAICRFYAEFLLRTAGKFHLQEFLDSWQKSIPEGMTSSLSQLQGLALIDLSSRPESITYFPSWDLPENINERFNTLFKKRTKWTYEEICPYIKDLAVGGQKVNTLLTKFARASVSNGVKVYSSKWPVV